MQFDGEFLQAISHLKISTEERVKANIGGHLSAIAAVAMKRSLVTLRFSFHAPTVFSWLQENKCKK
jgi:hypothetical protein